MMLALQQNHGLNWPISTLQVYMDWSMKALPQRTDLPINHSIIVDRQANNNQLHLSSKTLSYIELARKTAFKANQEFQSNYGLSRVIKISSSTILWTEIANHSLLFKQANVI